MSASDPRTDNCVEQRAGDYRHWHASFLLTLCVHWDWFYRLSRQMWLHNLYSTFFTKSDRSANVGIYLFLVLEKHRLFFWKAGEFSGRCHVGHKRCRIWKQSSFTFLLHCFPKKDWGLAPFFEKNFCLPDNCWASTGFPDNVDGSNQSQRVGCCTTVKFIQIQHLLN